MEKLQCPKILFLDFLTLPKISFTIRWLKFCLMKCIKTLKEKYVLGERTLMMFRFSEPKSLFSLSESLFSNMKNVSLN